MSTHNDALAEMRRYRAERIKPLSPDDFDRCYYQGLVDMLEHMEQWYAEHPQVDAAELAKLHNLLASGEALRQQYVEQFAKQAAEIARLREAAIEMLNVAPLNGDLRLLMLAWWPLNDADLEYANRYAQARKILKDALSQPQEPKP